jgi:predicted RNase H-like nuclease (RuvC/YqgF family)
MQEISGLSTDNISPQEEIIQLTQQINRLHKHIQDLEHQNVELDNYNLGLEAQLEVVLRMLNEPKEVMPDE